MNYHPKLKPAVATLLAALLSLPGGGWAQSSIRPSGSSTSRTGTGATSRAGATAARPAGGTVNGAAGGERQYKSNTLLGDATISIDPETRSLVIVTDENTEKELMAVIKNLDRPKPQVLIKVVFVEVTYNNSADIGVEGSYTFNVGKQASGATTGSNVATTVTNGTVANGTSTTTTTNTTDTSAAAVAASGVSSLFGLSNATQGTFVRVLTDDWAATLHALQTKGKVEVLSRPSIMARNNQEAVIVVGSEVPFVTNSQTTELGGTINTVQYDNVGIILRVTPFITAEGTVEMIVAPEISALTDQTVAISNNASAPVISKRSAETVVVTPNAQTIVIGGMMQTQRISSIQKIPLLGDIPYAGALFRRTQKSDVKSELMVFLTPYIVGTENGLEQLTQNEINKSSLMTKAFPSSETGLPEPDPLPGMDPMDAKEIRPATAVEQTTTTTTRTSVIKPRKRP